jgi:hypothetical protein
VHIVTRRRLAALVTERTSGKLAGQLLYRARPSMGTYIFTAVARCMNGSLVFFMSSAGGEGDECCSQRQGASLRHSDTARFVRVFGRDPQPSSCCPTCPFLMPPEKTLAANAGRRLPELVAL